MEGSRPAPGGYMYMSGCMKGVGVKGWRSGITLTGMRDGIPIPKCLTVLGAGVRPSHLVLVIVTPYT